MSQLLASLKDIQELTGDPVTEELVAPLQVRVYRIIRSQLSQNVNYPPIMLAGWHDPEHTPTRVRKIAAKLIAANLLGDQELYDEALNSLKTISGDKVNGTS